MALAKIRWSRRWIACVLLAAGVLVSFVVHVYCITAIASMNAEAKQNLLQLRKGLELGMPKSAIHERIGSGKFRYLFLNAQRNVGGDANRYEVHTPVRLTAENWVLIIYLKKDRIIGLRIRALDVLGDADTTEPPRGAPEDLGSWGHPLEGSVS